MLNDCIVYIDNLEVKRWNYDEGLNYSALEILNNSEIKDGKVAIIQTWEGQCNGVISLDHLKLITQKNISEYIFGFYGPDLKAKGLKKHSLHYQFKVIFP